MSSYPSLTQFLPFVPSFLHSALCQGLCNLSAYTVIPHYFRRRIGMANALTTSGVGIGGIVWPPVVILLQEHYGFKGATLIVAAFTLNLCRAGTLYRQLQRSSNLNKATEGTDKEANDKEIKEDQNKHKAIRERHQ